MRYATILRSACSFATAATLTVGSLTACTDPTSPDDSASTRNSSTATPTGQPAGDQLVTIGLIAPADSPFRAANGKAKFKSQGGERELEIEVEDVRAGTTLVFRFDGAEIGRLVANAFGYANLELNSDRGGSVPMSVAGKTVSIHTTSGAMIVSGSF